MGRAGQITYPFLIGLTGWLLARFWREILRIDSRTHELQESSEFLESLIQNIPNMIFVKEAKGLTFIRMNRAGEDLLGMSESELLGKSDFDFFSEDEAKAFTGRDREVLARSEVVDIAEEPLTTPKGLHILHTKKIPLFDREGRPQYLLGISEDITDQKKAETDRMNLIREQMARGEAEKIAQQLSFLTEASAALSQSLDLQTTMNAFAAVIVRNMADWCVIHVLAEDKKTLQHLIVAHADPAMARMLERWRQRRPGEPLTQNVRRVLKTGRSTLFTDGTNDVYQRVIENSEDLELIKKIGVRSSMNVAIRTGEKVIGVLTLVYSETPRSYGVSDLALGEELARRASFAIENALLYDRAQEASRAKSAFLANVSHEIRTPLGAMLGFADLMSEEESLTEDQKASVLTILRNGRQLLRIVDEILDLSKIESDYIQIEKIPFSLLQVLEEISSLMRMRADEKNLTFEIHVSPTIPRTIVSDPMRLRQILMNIVGNAIKFTEKGGINLQVSSSEIPGKSDHRRLDFIIRDTGIGISAEQSEKLFQPFMQAEAAMNRRFGGTGLGLFLSRRLARLLGGDVVLEESFAGRGSRFRVSVEVILSDEKEASAALQNRRVVSLPVVVAKKRLLIVDDSPDNRLLVAQYLKNAGLHIDTAENGQQAVNLALAKPYDVILMDIQMPEVDGFQAIRRLRASGYRGIVIALTAHAMKGDRARCLENGFNDYLQKPLDKMDLRRLLERYTQDQPPVSKDAAL